jgi:hypothetical protein
MRSATLILVAALVAVAAGAQEAPKPKEAPQAALGTKLWAAVSVSDTIINWGDRAWVPGLRPLPFMINFYLVNDGDKVVDPKVESSQLFINGKECKGKVAPNGLDWPFIMASGPRDGRWKALPPGDHLSFGYAMGDYFKEPGIYRIKWKGEGFEAPEVVLRVMPRNESARPIRADIDIVFAGETALEIVETTTDVEAKWRAVRILGALRYEPAVLVLTRSLYDKHRYVRSNAARALGDMKVKAATRHLIELLRKETDGGVIEQTSLALWKIGAKEAVPALKEVAGHKNSQTRMWVIQAIGELGDRKDIPFLAKYLDDPDDNVQWQAAGSIQKITGADFGFPSRRTGPIGSYPEVERAKKWWEKNKKDYPER